MGQSEQQYDFNKLDLENCEVLMQKFLLEVDFDTEFYTWIANRKIENQFDLTRTVFKFICFYKLTGPFKLFLSEKIEYPKLANRVFAFLKSKGIKIKG